MTPKRLPKRRQSRTVGPPPETERQPLTGNQLREMRRHFRKSQQFMAEVLGIDKRTYQRYETKGDEELTVLQSLGFAKLAELLAQREREERA